MSVLSCLTDRDGQGLSSVDTHASLSRWQLKLSSSNGYIRISTIHLDERKMEKSKGVDQTLRE